VSTHSLGELRAFQDAVDKFVDFRTEVEKLVGAAKPEMRQAGADLLIAYANAAIACIEGLPGDERRGIHLRVPRNMVQSSLLPALR
jgi:hypothetical protein